MITWLAWLAPTSIVTFTLVLARVAGIVVTAPIYGGVEIPPQVRALLAFVLAVLVAPMQMGRAVVVPQSLVELLLAAASEALIGVVLGLGVTILLAGMQLAGQVISQLGGMSIGEVFNPGLDANVPLFSQLLYLFALTLFALVGGHRLVMMGLLDTFAVMPPGHLLESDSALDTIVTLITQSTALGVRVAAPAMVALLLATLVLGIISRTLPQLNVLSFGFGISALTTFGIIWASLSSIAWVFEEQLGEALELVNFGGM